MAITLNEVKVNFQDYISPIVVDEFRKNNFLLDNLTFDDAVSPTGGGATMTYGYTRVTTQPTAAFRAINSEYTPQHVQKTRYTVDLKVFGGSYQIDRILAATGGIVNEVSFQMAQKIKAAQALFNDTVINGDSATNANAFDGLEQALSGSSTEINGKAADTAIDLSTSANVTSNCTAFLDILDEFLHQLDGTPSALLCNTRMAAKLRACARRATMYQISKNEFGQQVEAYGNVPFIDLGAKAGTNDSVIPISTGTTDDKGVITGAGLTSLYAVRLGLDGFHGVSMAGQSPIRNWMPDFTTAGAVKTGEVEMVAAVALKATKAAAVLRKIKVA